MQGFISYSHRDASEFKEFKSCMAQIERLTNVSFWADERIKAGNYWNDEIQNAIKGADIFLLLASPGFADSNYIWDHELPAITDRHKSKDALIIPVMLKPILIELIGDPFQAVPSDAHGNLTAVVDWKPHRAGYQAAIKQILESIRDHIGTSPASPFKEMFGGKS